MSGTTAEMRRAGRTESPEVVRVREESPESSFRELDDVFLQTQARIWLGEVLHVRLDEETPISDLLSDGELLFQVSKMIWKVFLKKNVGQRSTNIFIHERTSFAKTDGRYMAYPKVDSFLKICQILGLTGIDLCSPSDVVEKRDVRRVCMCIRSLSKKASLKNLKVPDFDIVTYTIAMPTNLVGGIRRYLEQSRHPQFSSNGYFTSKKKVFSKLQNPSNTLLSEFHESESIFNEREFESHFNSSSASNDLFSLDEDSLEESSEDEGSLSELQEDFHPESYEGQNVHKGIYSAEMDQILWPLSLRTSATQVQNHNVECKQTCGSSEKASPTYYMESCKTPRSHLSTRLLPACHASPGGVEEEIMATTVGNKSKPMFSKQGEPRDVEFERMNQQEFQVDGSPDPLESHFGECSEKVWLLIRKLEDAFQGVSNKTETRGEKNDGINVDTSPCNSLYQSPLVESSIGHIRDTSNHNSDKIHDKNMCFSDSEVRGSTVCLWTEARDSQNNISYGHERGNIEHDINAETPSDDSLKAIPLVETKLISDYQYYEDSDHTLCLPEKHACKEVEMFKIFQSMSPSQHDSDSSLRNTDFSVLESCSSDIGNESISRSFCFASEIHELHQNTKSEDIINMRNCSVIEDLQQVSSGLLTSLTLQSYRADSPYSGMDSGNIELVQPEHSHGQHASIILEGSYCDNSSDSLPCYACSLSSEEPEKPADTVSDKEDFFSPISVKLNKEQLQGSLVHRDVTDPISAKECEASSNPETPMCKSTLTINSNQSRSELVIKDCNDGTQMSMKREFVETTYKKQHAANILDECYCGKSPDTLPYYACSTKETIEPTDTTSDKDDFTNPSLETLKYGQLQDSPVYRDVTDPASAQESEAPCSPKTPMMCKNTSTMKGDESGSEFAIKDYNAEIQARMIGEFVETPHKKQHAANILDGCYFDNFSDTLPCYTRSTSSKEMIKLTDTISDEEDFSSPIMKRVKNEQLQDSPLHGDVTDQALVQDSEATCSPETPMMCRGTSAMKGHVNGSELAMKDYDAEIRVRMIGEFVEQECISYHDPTETQKDILEDDERILEKIAHSMLNQHMECENITESFTEISSAAMAEVCSDYGHPFFPPEASELCIDQVEVLATGRSCGQQTSLMESNDEQLYVLDTNNSPADDTGHAFQQHMQDCDISFSDDTDLFGNDVIKTVVYVENLNIGYIDIAEFPGLQTEGTNGTAEYDMDQHPCLEDHHSLESSTMDHSRANIPNPDGMCGTASLCENRKQNQHAQQHSLHRGIEEEEEVVSAEQSIELKTPVLALLDDHADSKDQGAEDHVMQREKDTKESSGKQVTSPDSNVNAKTRKPVRKVIKTVAGSVTLIGALLLLHHCRNKKSASQIPVPLQTSKPQKSGIFQKHKVEASNSDAVYYPGERLKL